MIKKIIHTLLISLLCVATGCAQQPKQYTYKVVKSYPHDINAYTQGLFFYKGFLYESSGQYGYSNLRKTDLATGRVIQISNIDRKYFAEGACILNNKIYVLTWQENTCFVYDSKTFKQIGIFRYATEGWGITTDSKYLIMSDGSSTIYFRDPDSFVERRRIDVKSNGRSVSYLNELEYINGEIWANVYTTNQIVRINPNNGNVTGIIDLTNILPLSMRTPNTDVLNGIAYDADNKRIIVTGKNWPKLFEINSIEKK
jgi:glutamine cyclotransferase